MMDNDSLVSSNASKGWRENGIRLIIVAGMVGISLLALRLTMNSRRMLAEQSPLAVDAQYLSLGELWEQHNYKRIIAVENRSASEVVVRQFASSCTCLSAEPNSVHIPPKTKQEITLTLDLTKPSPQHSPDGVNSLCVRLVPMLDNQLRPTEGWTFGATVRAFATFSPQSVQLWTDLYHGRADVHRSVDVLLHVPARRVTAISSSPFLSANVSRRAPDRYQLNLVFSTQAPPGPFNHSVQLMITGEDGNEKHGSRLEVQGVVNDEVQALPNQVSFGLARLGTTLTENLLLKPGANQGVRLLGVDNPSPDAVIEQVHGAEHGISFRLIQRVQQAGQQNYVVSFRLESIGPDRRTIVVPVQVNYYGFTPPKEQE